MWDTSIGVEIDDPHIFRWPNSADRNPQLSQRKHFTTVRLYTEKNLHDKYACSGTYVLLKKTKTCYHFDKIKVCIWNIHCLIVFEILN